MVTFLDTDLKQSVAADLTVAVNEPTLVNLVNLKVACPLLLVFAE